MKTLIIAKANATLPETPEGCLIDISDPCPNFADEEWMEKSMEFFNEQASMIVDALQDNLPGGTLDAVLRELLKRKASLLRVPYGI